MQEMGFFQAQHILHFISNPLRILDGSRFLMGVLCLSELRHVLELSESLERNPYPGSDRPSQPRSVLYPAPES